MLTGYAEEGSGENLASKPHFGLWNLQEKEGNCLPHMVVSLDRS